MYDGNLYIKKFLHIILKSFFIHSNFYEVPLFLDPSFWPYDGMSKDCNIFKHLKYT